MTKIRNTLSQMVGFEMGTPSTRAMCKELMKNVNKSVIQYAVKEALAVSITKIISSFDYVKTRITRKR